MKSILAYLIIGVTIFSYGKSDSAKRVLTLLNASNVANSVHFRLYTRETQNNPEFLSVGQLSPTLKRRLNYPIKFLVHGFLENAKYVAVEPLRRKVLEAVDANVITVDWSAGAFNEYYRVHKNALVVADYVGKFLNSIVSQGVDPKNIHMIGFSIGAHVCGLSAAKLGAKKVARITGLDPALPGFDGVSPDERLDSKNADFVDVIHTCSGLYGIPTPIGHADFYVNGGANRQPGCSHIDLGVCSHHRAPVFFAESLNPRHKFEAALCKHIPKTGPTNCVWSPYFMGYYLDSRARGIFYVQTRNKVPFALRID